MSRVPRIQEHLKTSFTAEAVSAARFRAYAVQADFNERPNLAARWRELAAERDRLAIKLLQAAGQVREELTAVADSLAEDRFETDVVYPKMIREVDPATADLLEEVRGAHERDIGRLRDLRTALQAADGDI